jgi:hypothetical protein
VIAPFIFVTEKTGRESEGIPAETEGASWFLPLLLLLSDSEVVVPCVMPPLFSHGDL